MNVFSQIAGNLAIDGDKGLLADGRRIVAESRPWFGSGQRPGVAVSHRRRWTGDPRYALAGRRRDRGMGRPAVPRG